MFFFVTFGIKCIEKGFTYTMTLIRKNLYIFKSKRNKKRREVKKVSKKFKSATDLWFLICTKAGHEVKRRTCGFKKPR